MEQTSNTYVVIQPHGKNQVRVDWAFKILHKKSGERMTCMIPAFNICFSALDRKSAIEKGNAFTKMFFDNYFLHLGEKKNGVRSLSLALHKMGFRAPNDMMVMKKVLKGVFEKTKFNVVTPSPIDFVGAEEEESHLQLTF